MRMILLKTVGGIERNIYVNAAKISIVEAGAALVEGRPTTVVYLSADEYYHVDHKVTDVVLALTGAKP